MRFDLAWQDTSGTERPIASVRHHFDPPPLGATRFYAVPFDADVPGAAAPASAGDALVLRIVVEAADGDPAYLPNGTGDATGGRIPSLRLPGP